MNIVLWIAWGLATVAVLICWLTIKRAVSWIVFKAVLAIPLDTRAAGKSGTLSIPVARLREGLGEIEQAIVDQFRFRWMRWLVRHGIRREMEPLRSGLLAFCEARRVEVLDDALLREWLHDRVARVVGDAAGSFAAQFFAVLLIVLVLGAIAAAAVQFS